MTKLEELIKELCPNGVEYKRLKDCSIMERGTAITQKQIQAGDIPVIAGGKKPAYYCDKFNREGETITIAGSGAYAGYLAYWDTPIFVSDAFSIKGKEGVMTKYLYYCLDCKQQEIYNTKKGGGVPHVHVSSIESLQIPLPPLAVQCEIVRILDDFTLLSSELAAELAARCKQYEYYRDKLLSFDKLNGGGCEVRWLNLEDVVLAINTGLNPRQFFMLNTEDATNFYVTIREIRNHQIVFSEKTDRINDEALGLCNRRANIEKGDVLFSGTGTIGETAMVTETPKNWSIKEGVYNIKPDPTIINSKFLMYLFDSTSIREKYMKKAAGGTVQSVPMAAMKKLQIPVPPIEEQKRIAEILDKFEKLCNDLSEGLPAEIEARHKQYEYYRDKLLTFQTV